MNSYEKLLDTASVDGLRVIERYDFSGTRLKGLYCDKTVAISQDIESDTERSCILAEELGHYYTSHGDIIDLDAVGNRKQELRARIWAYNKKVGLCGIIQAYKHGCQNLHDTADFLDVTEEFLMDALEQYRRHYGICAPVDNYIIFFEPTLIVMEKISD